MTWPHLGFVSTCLRIHPYSCFDPPWIIGKNTIFGKAVPIYAGARDSFGAPDFKYLISQMASSSADTCRCQAQMFCDAPGRLTFTDKCIGADRERGLLTGVQVTDEDNNQRGGT